MPTIQQLLGAERVSEIVPPWTRRDDRGAEELRPLEIIPGAVPYAEGSCLIKQGDTHVLCAATVEDGVPRWMQGKGRGWITAEYAMLPRATKQRTPRATSTGRQDGRGVEIQRLIGRSLRAVVDLDALGERQIIVDCDVLQADAGTRCAAISGGYVALALALRKLQQERRLKRNPLRHQVAAISVGLVRGLELLDLDYTEDSQADVDFNVVMTDADAFVEIQGTAEKTPFSPKTLETLLTLASIGLDRIFAVQRAVLK
jgi:ribonuclease PH